MTGIEMIAAERKRQVEIEGRTPEHDEQHFSGELASAAAVYALCDGVAPAYLTEQQVLMLWPWDSYFFKPSDRIRNLVKAGALIAAEIDRLLADAEDKP